MTLVPFSHLDSAGITRTLSQIADRQADLADAFFERRELLELPPEDSAPGFRVWRESGLAVRLVRDGQCWLAARDGISPEIFSDTVRRAARAMPRAPYPRPSFGISVWPDAPRSSELLDFPSALGRAVRAHEVSFPLRLTLRRHRRWVRIVGTRLSSGVEQEIFYSASAEMPWGRYGCLLPELTAEAAERLAHSLVSAYRAHQAAPPEPWHGACVLGPAATAVLLHEAVGHALEADTLALGGHPEAAIGVRLGSVELNVFDDPARAPESVRRTADDEGFPVMRRCLLRAGVVEQPLCDSVWAHHSEVLEAGAGRRGDRHLPPGPRSSHLELGPGESSREDLFAEAEGGLYLPEAERGHLHPLSGEFSLSFPYGHRIENRMPGAPVGRSSLRAHVSDVLRAVTAVGSEPRSAGAGWCAKGGMKLPVWATTPELRLEGVRIRP